MIQNAMLITKQTESKQWQSRSAHCDAQG